MQLVNCKSFSYKVAPFPASFFFIFKFSVQLQLLNKIAGEWIRTAVATALPTAPQPLPPKTAKVAVARNAAIYGSNGDFIVNCTIATV